MNQEKKLVLRSPLRKQLGGLWILACGIGAFVMWSNGLKKDGSEILLIMAALLFLMALHRCFTYSITVFQPGKVPTAKQLYCHFGVFKKEKEMDFDELEILRRDKFLPYCQLYAYSSLKYLKIKVPPADYTKYEEGKLHSPGLVLGDHLTKKECEAYIEKIWRYYDLWDESKVTTEEEKT